MQLPEGHPLLRKPQDGDGLKWHLPFERPFRLSGLNWFDEYCTYDRIPSAILPKEATRFQRGIKKTIPFNEWGVVSHSRCTSGAQIQFRSDSAKIYIDGIYGPHSRYDNCSPMGIFGFDLYIQEEDDETWRLAGVSRVSDKGPEFHQSLTRGTLSRKMRSFLIHLPTYCGVESLAIGLSEDAIIEPPKPWSDDRPIVWYGTSITQGGCASHAGLIATNIISRMRNQPVYNLGFSGNGCGEPEMAKIVASCKNPAMFIIDNAWNIGTIEELKMTLPPFIDIIRSQHPTTPIFLLSGSPGAEYYADHLQDPGPRPKMKYVIEEEALRRQANGDGNIHFINGEALIGEDFWNCVVDMVHLSDYGFIRQATALAPLLKSME